MAQMGKQQAKHCTTLKAVIVQNSLKLKITMDIISRI
jgi:hypothetical protein